MECADSNGHPIKLIITNMETNKQFISYICSLVPYGLKVQYNGEIYDLYGVANETKAIIVKPLMSNLISIPFSEIKPYLRPTSTLDDIDLGIMKSVLSPQGTAKYHEKGISTPISHFGGWIEYDYMARVSEHLKSCHIDYFDFIGQGLAIEAPDGMYYVRQEITINYEES